MAFPPVPTVVHPLLVHLTMSLVPTAAAFAAWHAVTREAWSLRAANAVLAAAAVFALATMGSGLQDAFELAPTLEGVARDTLDWHQRLGIVTALAVAGTGLFAWWKRREVATRAGWAWALAVALGVASLLVALTGWFGGSLVYDHGVGVP